MNITNESKKYPYTAMDYINILLLVLIFFAIVTRSLFSFCQSDESFYIALAHRFWLGDCPIADEWHPAQLIGVILLPFYSAFKLLVPSGTGVMLYFRILQNISSLLCAILVYTNLRRFQKKWWTLICAVLVLVFARENILGMSYYHLFAMSAVVIGTCFCVIAETDDAIIQNSRIVYIGICCVIGTLCMPFFIFGFLGISILLIAIHKRIIDKKRFYFSYLLSLFLMSVYPSVIIIRGILKDTFMKSLPYIFSDPEHLRRMPFFTMPMHQIIKKSFYMEAGSENIWLIVIFFFMVILSIISLFMKGRHDWVYVVEILLFCLVIIERRRLCLDRQWSTFSIFIPWSIPLVICSIKKAKHKIPLFLYLYGFICSVLFNLGSDAPSSFTVGALTVSMATVMALGILVDSLELQINPVAKRILYTATLVAFLFASSPILVTRILGVYRDDELQNLTERIDRGPAAGLYTSPEHKAQYYEVCRTLDNLQKREPEGKVLYSKVLPWAYFYTDYQFGAPSPWRNRISSKHLVKYYEIQPEKKPDIVVVFNPDIGKYEESKYDSIIRKKRPNKNKRFGRFYKELKNDYKMERTECATIYIKNK
jgi:hypothetical protein